MRKIFILTDLMFSGQHLYFENFIRSAGISHVEFTFEPSYWNLHNYEWDGYDELFCIIDHKDGYVDNSEFVSQLHHRMDLLRQNGFKFILANPWESEENMVGSKIYNVLQKYEYKKWVGGTAWFWFFMREKHKGKNFECDHSHKPYEYLYLNKQPRPHRIRLWNALTGKQLLNNSLTSFLGLKEPARLNPEYELPGVDPNNYPKYGKDQDIYVKPYEHTACSLISETNYNNEIFITEKLWKPILCGHFFIVLGNPLYLQKIREIGFRTFGQYFDESYDLETDIRKRIDKITELIESLENFNWRDAYLSSQNLRKHNHDHFWSQSAYQKEAQKSVCDFLGFE
jgi:hypothetical protein